MSKIHDTVMDIDGQPKILISLKNIKITVSNNNTNYDVLNLLNVPFFKQQHPPHGWIVKLIEMTTVIDTGAEI